MKKMDALDEKGDPHAFIRKLAMEPLFADRMSFPDFLSLRIWQHCAE